MTIHQHPIGRLVAWLACGGTLTNADLQELPLGEDVDRPAIERRIRYTAKKIAAARKEGDKAVARAIARATAAELIDQAGEPVRDRHDDDDDPREIAGRIPRSAW